MSPTRDFNLKAGAALNTPLDFEAHSVKVDNPSVQWLHLVGATDGGFVPPGTVGKVMNLPGLTEAQAEWAAPPGVVQSPAVAAQQATLRYYQGWLEPSAGTPTQILSSSPQQQLTSSPFQGTAGIGVQTSQDFTLPPGSNTVGVLVVGGDVTVAIIGKTSGVDYAVDPLTNVPYLPNGVPLDVPVMASVDPVVTVTVTNQTANPLTVYVSGIPNAVAVIAMGQPARPVRVVAQINKGVQSQGFGNAQLGAAGAWTVLANSPTIGSGNGIRKLVWSASINGAATVNNEARIGLKGNAGTIIELGRGLIAAGTGQTDTMELDLALLPFKAGQAVPGAADGSYQVAGFGASTLTISGVVYWDEG